MAKKMLIIIIIGAIFSGCAKKLFISDHGSEKIIRCDLKKNRSGDFNECVNSVIVTDVVDAFSARFLFTDSDSRKIYLYDDKLIQSISFGDFNDRDTLTTREFPRMAELNYDEASDLFIGATEQNHRLLLIDSKTSEATVLDKNNTPVKPYLRPTISTYGKEKVAYWLDQPGADSSKIFLKRKDLEKSVDDEATVIMTKEDFAKDGYWLGSLKYFLVRKEDGIEYMYWTQNSEDTKNDKIVKTNLQTGKSIDWLKNVNDDDETIRYPHGITTGNNGKTIFFVTNGKKIVGGAKQLKNDSPTDFSVLKVDHQFENPTIVRFARY